MSSVDEQVWFLLNYGQGYTYADVLSMPSHKRLWHVSKVRDKIKAEEEARKAAMSRK